MVGLFSVRAREIGRDEIRQAVDKARAIPLPPDREVLHLLPQEFILDEQSGVHDPMGMIASRLEVRVHMITAATPATQNVITAVNRAGVHVDDTVFEPLACADSVLRSDERELGICLADIGAGSTNLLVIQEGAVAHRLCFRLAAITLPATCLWDVHPADRIGKDQETFRQCDCHLDSGRK